MSVWAAMGEEQISFYDPGVGTYSPEQNRLIRWLEKLKMAASGQGVMVNVQEAYKYLMDYYEPGDRVYLFGYSRGAYTVRVLADMLHRCGLLTKGSNNLIPYLREIYSRKDEERAAGFKSSFSRECKPYFIGVWDTVASTGWLFWRVRFSNRRLNGDVMFAYHAVSVDERRSHFPVAYWDESDVPEGQTIEQVWFPGFHADVGGQKADRRISDITLGWMLRHAQSKGLVLRDEWRESLRPDPSGKIEPSHRQVWRLLPTDLRRIPEGAKVHQSVLQRIADSSSHYRPANLPKSYVEAE